MGFYKNIDFMSLKGSGQGDVAKKLMTKRNMDPSIMRPWVDEDDGKTYITVHTGGDKADPENYSSVPLQNNDGTLRRDEWKLLDEAILGVARQRIGGYEDLISRGLTFNLGNAMGTTVLEHHRGKTDMTAQLSMDGLTRGQGNRPVYDTQYLPIPIIHVDYEINARELEASRKLGNPLNTDAAEEASFTVREYLEDMLFTDTTYAFGGGTIYSYANFPSRATGSLTANWTASAADPVADIINMKQDSIANYHYGPWVVYIPTGYETVLDEDYSVSGQSLKTMRERILNIGGIEDIKVVDRMPADTVFMVEMQARNVRLVQGMGITNVEWEDMGGFVTKYKVMTIQVPQLRADKNGRCGIVHYA